MLKASGKTIIMDEGDYGLDLPFKIRGDILSTDTIKFTIKENEYSDEVLYKEFTNLSEEDGVFVFVLSFTQEDSKKLLSGNYKYGIKQYRDGEFLSTIIKSDKFIVEKGV